MNPFDALRGIGRAALIGLGLLLLLAFACGVASASTCSITEFAERPPVTYQAAFAPYLATSTVTYTTTQVQSDVFTQNTALIRISCDADAYINFGINPGAVVGMMRLPANSVEYFAITPASTPPYTALRMAIIGAPPP